MNFCFKAIHQTMARDEEMTDRDRARERDTINEAAEVVAEAAVVRLDLDRDLARLDDPIAMAQEIVAAGVSSRPNCPAVSNRLAAASPTYCSSK